MAADHRTLPMPAYVTADYGDDERGRRMAISRWSMPTTDPAERAIAATFANAASYPCVSCGLYAFPTASTRCFWCKAEDAKWGAT